MNEITPELLAEFKERMKLSDDEDQNLTRILKSSVEDLTYKCGPYNIATSEVFKELVFNRARYEYNDAAEFFDQNFLSQITRLALSNPYNNSGGELDPVNPGEPGAPGKSAYQIAVENGFAGTVGEWLESLKGERGERGLPGEPGPAGRDGTDANVTAANIKNALGYEPITPTEVDAHIFEYAPHRYGNKFEWRYNPTTNSLDLVVLD